MGIMELVIKVKPAVGLTVSGLILKTLIMAMDFPDFTTVTDYRISVWCILYAKCNRTNKAEKSSFGKGG